MGIRRGAVLEIVPVARFPRDRARPQAGESPLCHRAGASFISLAPTYFTSQNALMPPLCFCQKGIAYARCIPALF